MTGHIEAIAFDCGDVEALAAFWCAALDYRVTDRWRDEHGLEYVAANREGATMLLFQPVPEGKTAKNRVHLDIRPTGPQREAVDRLVGLGARVLSDDTDPRWITLADPEGNEFCVLRGPGD
jgi:catechol 2,3-dioxygenase-like lactoylglutathione lyase family enzyme